MKSRLAGKALLGYNVFDMANFNDLLKESKQNYREGKTFSHREVFKKASLETQGIEDQVEEDALKAIQAVRSGHGEDLEDFALLRHPQFRKDLEETLEDVKARRTVSLREAISSLEHRRDAQKALAHKIRAALEAKGFAEQDILDDFETTRKTSG